MNLKRIILCFSLILNMSCDPKKRENKPADPGPSQKKEGAANDTGGGYKPIGADSTYTPMGDPEKFKNAFTFSGSWTRNYFSPDKKYKISEMIEIFGSSYEKTSDFFNSDSEKLLFTLNTKGSFDKPLDAAQATNPPVKIDALFKVESSTLTLTSELENLDQAKLLTLVPKDCLKSEKIEKITTLAVENSNCHGFNIFNTKVPNKIMVEGNSNINLIFPDEHINGPGFSKY